MHREHFTIKQANDMIPWLEKTLKQALSIQQRLSKLQDQMLQILRKSLGNGHKNHGRTVSENQSTVEKYESELERVLQDITNKGMIVRDLNQGLVDFPAFQDNHQVYLCWLVGEPKVSYWHECDTGFQDRQLL